MNRFNGLLELPAPSDATTLISAHLGEQIGQSDCNSVIPVYALYTHTLIQFENPAVSILEYHKVKSLYGGCSGYAALFRCLKTANHRLSIYSFTKSNTSYALTLGQGYLAKDDEVLMCMCVKTDRVLEEREGIFTSLVPEDLVLIVNVDFSSNPIYYNQYKRVQRDYITPLLSLGVDCITTKAPDSWAFKNNTKEVEFTSLGELSKHLEEEVPKLMLI